MARENPVTLYEMAITKAFRVLMGSPDFVELLRLFIDHDMVTDGGVVISSDHAPFIWVYNREKYDIYCKIIPCRDIESRCDTMLKIFTRGFEPPDVWSPSIEVYSTKVNLSECLTREKFDWNKLRDFFEVLEKVKRSQLLRKPLSIRRLDFEK